MPASEAWKLVLAVVLAAGIFISARAHAPRRAVPGADLAELVIASVALYAVGGLASATGHTALAGILYGAGIMSCAFAAWLSRGTDSEDPPGGEEPVDEQPPPEPDGLPGFDWAAFERDFRAYAKRPPVGVD